MSASDNQSVGHLGAERAPELRRNRLSRRGRRQQQTLNNRVLKTRHAALDKACKMPSAARTDNVAQGRFSGSCADDEQEAEQQSRCENAHDHLAGEVSAGWEIRAARRPRLEAELRRQRARRGHEADSQMAVASSDAHLFTEIVGCHDEISSVQIFLRPMAGRPANIELCCALHKRRAHAAKHVRQQEGNKRSQFHSSGMMR